MGVFLLFYLLVCISVNIRAQKEGDTCRKKDGTAGICKHYTECTDDDFDRFEDTCSFAILCCAIKSSTIQPPEVEIKEEGDLCLKQDGSGGVCTHLENCTTAVAQVRAGGRPDICFFDGKVPVVCCEDALARLLTTGDGRSTSPSYLPFDENNRALRECREFHRSRNTITNSTTNELPTAHIFVGGKDAEPKQYPHMALLGYAGQNGTEWQCGGSLISLEFVLTAAHCLYSKKHGKVQFVRLGELDLNSTTDDAEPQDFTIKEMYSHPDYKSLSNYHDIALIRLDKPAKLTDYVKPACLQVRSNLTDVDPEGMGWGLTSRGGDRANILQSGLLRFVPYEKCKRIYGKSFRLKDGIVDELQICADGGEEMRDTCQGDSGGPLQVANNDYEFSSFPEIVGITSFGKDCALTAGVYTRVSHYIPWIEKIVWSD